MAFGDQIREQRQRLELSQQRLAEKAAISLRSVQNYESNRRYPNNIGIVKRIAQALGTTPEALLSEETAELPEAVCLDQLRSHRDTEALLGEIGTLFAEETVPMQEKDRLMRAIMEFYWESKQLYRKELPKKYRKEIREK